MYCRCGKKSTKCCLDCDNRYLCASCDFSVHDRNIRSDHSRTDATLCQLCYSDLGKIQCNDCPAQKDVRGILLCFPCLIKEHSSTNTVEQKKLVSHSATSVSSDDKLFNIEDFISKKRKEYEHDEGSTGSETETESQISETETLPAQDLNTYGNLENVKVILHEKATFCACMTNKPLIEVFPREKAISPHFIKIQKALFLGLYDGKTVDKAVVAIRNVHLEMERFGSNVLNWQRGNARSVCFYKRESDIPCDRMPTGRWASELARLIAEIFYVKFYPDREIKGFVFYGTQDQVDIACLAFEMGCNRMIHLSRDAVKKQDPNFMLNVVETMRKAQEEEVSDYRKSESLKLRRIRSKNFEACMNIAVEVARKLKLAVSSKR